MCRFRHYRSVILSDRMRSSSAVSLALALSSTPNTICSFFATRLSTVGVFLHLFHDCSVFCIHVFGMCVGDAIALFSFFSTFWNVCGVCVRCARVLFPGSVIKTDFTWSSSLMCCSHFSRLSAFGIYYSFDLSIHGCVTNTNQAHTIFNALVLKSSSWIGITHTHKHISLTYDVRVTCDVWCTMWDFSYVIYKIISHIIRTSM